MTIKHVHFDRSSQNGLVTGTSATDSLFEANRKERNSLTQLMSVITSISMCIASVQLRDDVEAKLIFYSYVSFRCNNGQKTESLSILFNQAEASF